MENLENNSKMEIDAMDAYVKETEQIHKKQMRIWRVIQGVGFALAFAIILIARSNQGQADMQKNIANEIIRFHVLANSDSAEDQALKLKVKNEVVVYMQQLLKDCNSRQEAEAIIRGRMDDIISVAKAKIVEEGYSYEVTAKLENCYFPVKQYGDLTFPEGEYEAFRILIGKAEGKNWWCVMFPSLCMVNETYTVVPDQSKEQLQHVLTEEEYDTISKDEKESDQEPDQEPETEYRFWLVDWITGLF